MSFSPKGFLVGGCARLFNRGGRWFLAAALLTLSANARAQTDTTRPTITFDSLGNTTFSALSSPPLTIDASLRAGQSGAWLGEGIANTSAQGQTLAGIIAAGATRSGTVKIVRHGGEGSQTVSLSVPAWADFAAADWQARFYDAPTGGNDITAQITSADGWQTVMNDGDERVIRVEVRAPAGAATDALQSLSLRASANPTSETPVLDVVKFEWRVIASAQPDVWMSRLNADGDVEAVAGKGEISPTVQ